MTDSRPSAPAIPAINDDLRDRLVAISAAIADQDDRAAQAMLREILKAAQPAPSVAAAKQSAACDKAPAGWLCIRQHGHDGPCAAEPTLSARSDEWIEGYAAGVRDGRADALRAPQPSATPQAAPAIPRMSADEVNGLPDAARAYIHALVANADPAGMVRENMQLRDTNAALQAAYRRMADALRTATAQPAIAKRVPLLAYPPLPRVGAIGYASVVDIDSYAKTLTIGPHLPGVRDIALWTTDQMRAYVDADRTARAQADSVTAPAGGLHPKTANLVQRFAAALAEKLASAEKKYGYSDGWSSPDWMDECRQKLAEHVAKGDPRDVAAYCAFLWHHEASTAPTPPAQAADSVPACANQAVIEYRYTGGTHWCPLGPAERMKPNFDGVYRLQGGVFPVEAPADSQPAAVLTSATGGDWTQPTTVALRLGDAMQLLCGGKRPPDDMVQQWLDNTSESLQEFAASNGPAWAQGIGLIDAALVMVDQPTEIRTIDNPDRDHEHRAARAQADSVAPAVAGEPVAPDFYTACALYEGGGEAGWIPLPSYSNETEHGVKHLVLEAARKEGYKGTAAGRLLELGWEIRPVYLTPQPTKAHAG